LIVEIFEVPARVVEAQPATDVAPDPAIPAPPEPSRAPGPSRVLRPGEDSAPAVASVTPPAASVEVVASPFASGEPEESAEQRRQRAMAALQRGPGWIPPVGGEGGDAPLPGPRVAVQDPERAAKLVRELIETADKNKGLGFGGPVVSAARTAALSVDAPSEGAATFEVLTDADGVVTSVRMTDGQPGWSRAAASLISALRGQKLRIPSGTSGVAVIVRVEARMQLPSGQSSSTPKFGGGGLQFDVADVAAKPSRVVSSRLLSERRR
jgi:hypothetical protein